MEFLGQPRPSGACGFLGVPGLSPLDLDVDDDEGEVVIGIRPKSSPLPRRKTSVSDDDSEPEPPLCGSRRVSFADAKGLSLVQVKEFDTWDVPKLPGYDSSEGDTKDLEEYIISPLTFSIPLSTEELLVKVRDQKVELENVELLPGTTILKGVIRVLNISFTKAVYIRTTLDFWSSHFDLLAEYVPGSSDDLMDCFSFKLTLVPPFGEQGARVDFCVRYETPVGTFWANNNNRNYGLCCHKKVKERKEKPHRESANKKSCLKPVGQSFSTAENVSAMEASSPEYISTDLSQHGEKRDTIKTKQISDVQSGTLEEDKQKVLTESRQNCSRRNRRKAARMARVKDLFAQRGGEQNDVERDGSPPEAKQAAPTETPVEKQSDVKPYSEDSSKSEGNKPIPDTSPAQENTSNKEPEKSESTNMTDSATLRGSESPSVSSDKTLHSDDEPAPAEPQSINKSVSKAEEGSEQKGMSCECTGNIADELDDSVISAVSSESLVSQTDSFTFGTVVAPLYHQVFGRAGSESQSVGDWGNPVRAALNAGDLTQSYPHAERRETSCAVQTGVTGDNDKVQGDVIQTQESKQECIHATPNSPPTKDEDIGFTTSDLLDHSETLQDPVICSDQRCTDTSEVPETFGDAVENPHAVNSLNTDSSNPQPSTEGLHLQGEAQEDNPTHDLQSQTTGEATENQLPEHTRPQIKATPHAAHAQSEMEEVTASLETLCLLLQPPQSEIEHVSDKTDPQTSGGGSNECKCEDDLKKDDDVGKTVTVSTDNGISDLTEADKLFEALHDLNPNHINNSAAEETGNSFVPCFEILEETAPQISVETREETNNVEEENKKALMRDFHIQGDTVVARKDEDTLKYEEIIVSEKIEHCEIEAAVPKQTDFCLEDAAEVKNWETMVEEEEENILTDEEDSKAIRSKAEDIEAVEEDQEETENRDRTETEKEETEDEMVVITATIEKENKADEADVLDEKQRNGEEQIGEIVAGDDREEVDEELEYVVEEELAEVTEVEKMEEQEDTELEKEQHFAEIREANIGRINVQQEKEIEGEEEMERGGEEKPDYKEEIQADEAGELEIVDAKLENRTIEDRENKLGCFEEGLDITQNKVEDGLSAPVNNVHDNRVTDKENTREGQNAQTPAEMHPYKEEDRQSNQNVTHDQSKAARDERESTATDGGSCSFTDEFESEQLSHDSASAESDSDDEVELYMHCLRAVHTGAQANKERNKDTGFGVGKRPSVSRSKLLSIPMPSITESLDEDPSRLQDDYEDMDIADFQPVAADLPASSGQESTDRNASRWKETFSCSNICRTLLYATLFLVFAVVAYHYDFLACLGLYLISVIWLCCQGERQPVKNNRLG